MSTPASPSLEGATRIPQTESELPSHPTQTTLSTPELIEATLSRGEITGDQRLLYLAYAVYEPDSLPEAYRSQVPWRGTMIVQELKQVANSKEAFCALLPEIQQEIRRLIPNSVDCSP